MAVFHLHCSDVAAMKCKHLDELKHGSFEIHPRNAFGSVVRYSCDEGYILSGKKERICQGDGRWSGDAPTCETEGSSIQL